MLCNLGQSHLTSGTSVSSPEKRRGWKDTVSKGPTCSWSLSADARSVSEKKTARARMNGGRDVWGLCSGPKVTLNGTGGHSGKERARREP